MSKSSFHLVRVGIAITFLWIGILIIKQPEAWGGYLRPWAVRLLPVPLEHVMLGTAVIDIIIGALLLVDRLTHIAAFAGALHLTIVLITSGITDITVRDIGLCAASLAVMIDSLPKAKVDSKNNKHIISHE